MRFKSFFISLLVLIIGLVGIFGFAFMMDHVGLGQHGCVAALAAAKPCPNNMNPFDYTAFHFGLLKTFASSIANQFTSVVLLMVAFYLAAWFIWRVFLRMRRIWLFAVYHRYKNRALGAAIPVKLRMARWLSLHEARDPYNLYMGAFALI